MNLHRAILEHNPAAVFTLEGEQIVSYAGGPMPTLEELQAAWARVLAREAAAAGLKAARKVMAEKLEGLGEVDKALFFPLRLAVEQALDRGEIGVARKLVQDVEVPEHLITLKAEILGLFPAA